MCLFPSFLPRTHAVIKCRKCYECQQDKINTYLLRLRYMTKQYPNAYFITLTFNDEYLNEYGTDKKDTQYFFKTLDNVLRSIAIEKMGIKARDYKDDKRFSFKYVCVSEHGGHFHRPHYHILFWFIQMPFELSHTDFLLAVERSWFPSCRISVDRMTDGSCKYIAKTHSNHFLSQDIYCALTKTGDKVFMNEYQLCRFNSDGRGVKKNIRGQRLTEDEVIEIVKCRPAFRTSSKGVGDVTIENFPEFLQMVANSERCMKEDNNYYSKVDDYMLKKIYSNHTPEAVKMRANTREYVDLMFDSVDDKNVLVVLETEPNETNPISIMEKAQSDKFDDKYRKNKRMLEKLNKNIIKDKIHKFN